jgi:ribosomal protein S18 acetylase RimI-like enzyme
MTVTVEIVKHVDDALVEGLNFLLPQLSSSAPPLTRDAVQELFDSPALTVFVARDDERIIGSLTLVIFPIPTGLRAWIEDVVVDGATRGAGIGQALTTAAIDESRRRGVRSIDLTSRPSRVAANKLYVKLGFALRETNVYRFAVED